MNQNKILVAYFSASGQTARVAKTLAEAAKADLFEIEPAVKYTSADLNWQDKQSRSSKEKDNVHARPEIAQQIANIHQYDVIFIGFPIWWYTVPRIIETFLESYDFAGQTLIPFATSGGSSLGNLGQTLPAYTPQAKWKPGRLLNSRENAASLQAWIKDMGI